MKATYLILIASMFFVGACAKEHKAKLKSQKLKPKVEEKTTTKSTSNLKIEDLKYVGVVRYEFGIAKDKTLSFLSTSDRTPVSRIYLCVDRSGNKMIGQVKINFAELGIADYEVSWLPSDNGKVGERTDSFKIPSLVLDYEWTGKFEDYRDITNGRFTFQSYVSDVQLIRTFPEGGPVTDYHRSLYTGPAWKFMQYDLSEGTLASEASSVFESNGVNYYVHSTFARAGKNDKGVFPIDICEKENKYIVYEKVDSKK